MWVYVKSVLNDPFLAELVFVQWSMDESFKPSYVFTEDALGCWLFEDLGCKEWRQFLLFTI